MAKKTRAELSTEAVVTNLPDNNQELITPATERTQLASERESTLNYKDDITGTVGQALVVGADGESVEFEDLATGNVSVAGNPTDNRVAVWLNGTDLQTTSPISIAAQQLILLAQTASSHNIGGGNLYKPPNEGGTRVTGINNTGFGYLNLNNVLAGTRNIALGYNSGSAITSGSNNVVIGSDPGASIATLSNHIIISDGDGNIRQTFDNSGDATFYGALSGTSAVFSSSVTAQTGEFISGGQDGATGSVVRISTASVNAAARNWGIVNTWNNYGDLTFRVSNAQGGNALLAGTSKMVLFSSGNVAIGNTTDAGYKLDVDGELYTSGSSAALFIQSRDLAVNFAFFATSDTALNFYSTNGGTVGNFNRTTGTYTATSNINVKKDFEQSTLGLNPILGLKPTLYRIKTENNTEKHLGLIAQEVKEFIPQAFVNNDGFIGLDYQAITATLVKAIQEQQTIIEDLKARIEKLEV